ncbi:MAG: S8 family serine peptidase, partial [Gammaproteobacteria bacterium]
MSNRNVRLCTVAAAATLLLSPVLEARSPDGRKAEAGPQTYLVVLEEAPLVERLVRDEEAAVARLTQAGAPAGKSRTSPLRRPDGKFDLEADRARSHLEAIDARFEEFQAGAAAALGRPLETTRRFRTALNGFTATLTPAEAERLAALPGVAGVEPERFVPLHTYAGPEWIGARDVWEGVGFLPESRGEGVVIG